MKEKKPRHEDENGNFENVEHAHHRKGSFGNMEKLSAAFENPLASRSKEQLMEDVEAFCRQHQLADFTDDFKKGALVAQNPSSRHPLLELTAAENAVLDDEQTHQWSQPFTLYWLMIPRRGTIFVSCFVAAVASIWEGVAHSWANLSIARFVLDFGIGPKSATVPVYAAECAPAPIRGALVMRKVSKAFRSFQRLRFSNVQAARDTCYTYVGVELEREANQSKNLFTQFMELFTVPRNRRATFASWIVMFGQQFCGGKLSHLTSDRDKLTNHDIVNIIAYYSTTIFVNADYSTTSVLLASMGTGILNWVSAVPALFTIDRWGRRNLPLFTFPFFSITLLWTGLSFFIQETKARVAMVTTGMYLFEVFYSPGEGPVPFTYSAEAFPVHVRDVGMSRATATIWCFNFIISFTWKSLQRSFTTQGVFGWFAEWCMILWVLILLFVPETKALTLEELNQVFGLSTRKRMSYQIKNFIWHFKTWILRQKVEPLPPLYVQAEKLNES
ncbi:hypothetical protein PWT90_00790 [Aphanocladium album]|nr:hypothetical protein PWT90_00790 [Aphanocladium album]